jgi:probable rRNA maturation factor
VSLELELQIATQQDSVPSKESFVSWSKAALRDEREQAEIVIRLVGEDEVQGLNREYRGKNRPTNVLSFPSNLPEIVNSDLLGDLVICVPVVIREAQEQGKTPEAHWAHMVVHGVLHLIGYDHQNEDEAQTMERLEGEVMASLGFQDPYREEIYE